MSEPFVLSLSKYIPPFDRLKANGNLILHKAESIAKSLPLKTIFGIMLKIAILNQFIIDRPRL